MDTHCLLKLWEAPKDTLAVHWKKIASGFALATGIAVLGMMCTHFGSFSGGGDPGTACESSYSAPSHEIPDTCPWQLVMSDLTHRLRLLEMAFKEQVIAREVIAAEVTNQSFSNLELEKKLDEFVTAWKTLSARIDKINEQMSELTSRLYSDECLGFLVLVFIVVEIILAARAKLSEQQHGRNLANLNPPTQTQNTETIPRSVSNSSINGAPLSTKHSVSFRQEVCIATFSKSVWKQSRGLTETLLSYVTDDARVAIKQAHIIDSPEAMKECPKAKLYILLIDCDIDQCDGFMENIPSVDLKTERGLNFDLPIGFLHQLKLSGGHMLAVFINDEGSQKLPSHALYNPDLSVIPTIDIVQELASNGRLLSIWKDFSIHQLSHLKKIGKSLNLKGK